MANFKPLNNYSFYLLDKLIAGYRIKPPFLDIGFGAGDLSIHLVKKGWSGKAIDFSDEVLNKAKPLIAQYPNVQFIKQSAFKEKSKYNSILMWDVIEHIKEDEKMLRKIYNLLSPDGFLIMSVPSNPREWRWDDEFYGHFRRYTAEDLTLKLKQSGFKTLVIWDLTFPFFWLIRRIYTKIKHPTIKHSDHKERTKASSINSAWEFSLVSKMANEIDIIWKPLFIIQELIFKKATGKGFAFLVLAQKI